MIRYKCPHCDYAMPSPDELIEVDWEETPPVERTTDRRIDEARSLMEANGWTIKQALDEMRRQGKIK